MSEQMRSVPGGANRRFDCDGYRPDTLGGALNSKPTGLALNYITDIVLDLRRLIFGMPWRLRAESIYPMSTIANHG